MFCEWFLGDVECFKCSDWITVTIVASSGRGWFEGDKDQIQTIQAHISYVYLTTFTDTAAILNLLEYYGMPRGRSRSLSIYARFSGKKRTSLYIFRVKGDHCYIQTRHNDFFPITIFFPGKISIGNSMICSDISHKYHA